jgi:hypothetical protein
MAYDPDPEVSPELPDDVFDEFASCAEIFAFIHHREGETGLRQLLAMPLKDRTREDLQDAAAELQSAGLNAVAAIVTEAAARALPMTDWSFCCYSPDAGRANRESWLRSQQRRQRDREIKRAQWSHPPRVKPRPEKPKPKN